MSQILDDEFFHCGYCPPRLPTTCLSMPPRFDRDLPNNMLSTNQLLTNVINTNQMMCNPQNGGVGGGGSANLNANGNNQLLNGLNQNNPGGLAVAGSLRKPLLELNGSIILLFNPN